MNFSKLCNAIFDKLCPLRAELLITMQMYKELEAMFNAQSDTLNSICDGIAKSKTSAATTLNKLSVSSHAIHRYRERHKGGGSDDEISAFLYKAMVKQLATMDNLPDGVYSLMRNVRGIIHNNTLVTILPKRSNVPTPKLK